MSATSEPGRGRGGGDRDRDHDAEAGTPAGSSALSAGPRRHAPAQAGVPETAPDENAPDENASAESGQAESGPAQAAAPLAAPPATEPVPAARRGSLRIHPRAVDAIGHRAAWEAVSALVPGTAAESLRRPRVAVSLLHQDRLRVRIDTELPYPVDVTGASRMIRRHVSERLAAMTGMTVTEAEVHVSGFAVSAPHARRGALR